MQDAGCIILLRELPTLVVRPVRLLSVYTFRLVLSLYIRHFDDVAGGNRSSPPTPAQRRRRRVTVVVVEMERMPREEINARPARL